MLIKSVVCCANAPRQFGAAAQVCRPMSGMSPHIKSRKTRVFGASDPEPPQGTECARSRHGLRRAPPSFRPGRRTTASGRWRSGARARAPSVPAATFAPCSRRWWRAAMQALAFPARRVSHERPDRRISRSLTSRSIHGICMGGGAGVSVHGRYRLADATLSFAMPETGIGFIPDVGSSYFLSRLPDEMGMYLGLTGLPIGLGDALDLGLMTHAVAREDFDAVIDAPGRGQGFRAFRPQAGGGTVADHRKRIATHFRRPFGGSHSRAPGPRRQRFRADNGADHPHPLAHLAQACVPAIAPCAGPEPANSVSPWSSAWPAVFSRPTISAKACAPRWWTRTAIPGGSRHRWQALAIWTYLCVIWRAVLTADGS